MPALSVNRHSVCPGPSTPPTILDGHNRYEICTRLGIEFETVEAEDCHNREAAIAWIVANQLGRRNLTPSQKAALALEIEKQLAAEAGKRRAATLKQNQATDGIILSEREKGRARNKAAEMTGASPAYVQQAKQIEQDAPEIFEQVKQGKLNIPQAKREEMRTARRGRISLLYSYCG